MTLRPDSVTTTTDLPEAGGPDFVHLHVHSEFSLLDGLGRIPSIVARAKALGQPAIALTDHGNLHGLMDFYTTARKAGIKPIIGCEVYVAPRSMTDREPKVDDRSYHLTLLARDLDGYRNLLRMVSAASIDGFYYKPRVDRALLERHATGLIALSGCMSGEVPRLLLDGQTDAARRSASWYADLFGRDHYLIEVQNQNLSGQDALNRNLVELARGLDLRVVAANDAHYVHPADHKAHDVLLCIQTGATVDQKNRMALETGEFYLKSGAEMLRQFTGLEDALSNTRFVADQVDLTLDFSRVNLPHFEVPPGETPSSYLRTLSYEGIQRRYGRVTDEQRTRLDYELSVIDRTGYPLYFLIVADYVRFARERGILAMPRGSVAGSLVIHGLGVCDIDPLAYKLMFERFLHDERIGMPDIDMDFADDRREEVIRYVQEKYGRDRVAQIITFGTMAARAAVRDVGRALGLSFAEVNPIARAIAFGSSLAEARETPDLKEMIEADPRVREVIDLAEGVEGVARNASTHAAGIVISRDPLVDHVPLQRSTKGDDNVVTQWAMNAVEQAGMLKMDFLGLANLTIVDRTLTILKTFQGIALDLDTIPTDDTDPMARSAFEMLGEGETTAVFQLESDGMRRCLRGLKPTKVSDLIAIVALYRPGPMDNIPAFTAAKNGQSPVTFLHPVLKPIMEETYGICVYQDQVLMMVREIAGFTWGEADVLRKAMGKKIGSLMAEQREKFRTRAREKGYNDELISALWETIAPFAGYGFPKGHAAAYATLAYQTAFLKANYPAAYMAAVLTSVAGTADKVAEAIAECRRLGVIIGPPNVNRSAHGFTLERPEADTADTEAPGEAEAGRGAHTIRFGLSGVKFVGDAAVECLIKERERNGPFIDVADLCSRLDLRQWNKRSLESLVKAGALDAFGDRASLLSSLDTVIGAGQQAGRARISGQTTLFDLFADAHAIPVAATNRPVVDRTLTIPERRQQLTWEKEVLGLYLSEHPLTSGAAALRAASSCTIASINADMVGEIVSIAGSVASVRPVTTKKGDTMAAVQLEDLSGTIELVVFPRTYQQSRTLLVEDSVVLIKGKIDARNDTPQIVCDSVEAFDPDIAVDDVSVPAPTTPRNRPAIRNQRTGAPMRSGATRTTATQARPTDVPAPVAAETAIPGSEASLDHGQGGGAVGNRDVSTQVAAIPGPAPVPVASERSASADREAFEHGRHGDGTDPWIDDPWAGMDVVNPTPPAQAPVRRPDNGQADHIISEMASTTAYAASAPSVPVAGFTQAPMTTPAPAGRTQPAAPVALPPEPSGRPDRDTTEASLDRGQGGGVEVSLPVGVEILDLTMQRQMRDDRDVRTLQRLDTLLRNYPGETPVVMRFASPTTATTVIEIAQKVDVCPELINTLQRELGPSGVRLRGGPTNDAGSPDWNGRATA